MEIQPTTELKARFFAQYLGQKVLGSDSFNPHIVWKLELDDIKTGKGWLVLKHVSEISEEDAIQVAKINNIVSSELIRYGKIISKGLLSFNKKSGCTIILTYQYLQSKSHALPFMGIPVETFIEWGWVKLSA